LTKLPLIYINSKWLNFLITWSIIYIPWWLEKYALSVNFFGHMINHMPWWLHEQGNIALLQKLWSHDQITCFGNHMICDYINLISQCHITHLSWSWTTTISTQHALSGSTTGSNLSVFFTVAFTSSWMSFGASLGPI